MLEVLKNTYFTMACCKGKLLTFLISLFLVGATLALGALCFMYLEEPPLSEEEKYVVIIDQEDFLMSVKQKYNVSISAQNSKALLEDFQTYFEELHTNTTRKRDIDSSDDREKVYGKWFYFCNILSTTIGK